MDWATIVPVAGIALWQPGLVDKAAAKITLDLNIFRGSLADLRALGGS